MGVIGLVGTPFGTKSGSLGLSEDVRGLQYFVQAYVGLGSNYNTLDRVFVPFAGIDLAKRLFSLLLEGLILRGV